MTPKQREVLDFILSYSSDKGYAPSQHEIAHHFGFKSLGTVQNYLVRLERQGLLRKARNARRGAQVVTAASTPPSQAVRLTEKTGTVPLPLLGKVAAGKPIEAIENDRTVDIPESLLKGGDSFVLKVSGDSMIGDGILDGDYVIIRKQAHAANGQTVVALIGGEATIKRYYRRGGRIELHAANPAYDPILVDPISTQKEFKIEGILTGLIRSVH